MNAGDRSGDDVMDVFRVIRDMDGGNQLIRKQQQNYFEKQKEKQQFGKDRYRP